VIINSGKYYDHLLKWMERSYQERFVKEKFRSLYYVTDNPADALTYIEKYEPIELPVKW
jgi:predicted Rossmann-fold nucleotide-binding protein